MIHAVVGQNGAGKTTFARVVPGIVKPASGSVSRFRYANCRTGKVQAARAAGVELVHQSFALPPSFTVAEAMEFGAERQGQPLYAPRPGSEVAEASRGSRRHARPATAHARPAGRNPAERRDCPGAGHRCEGPHPRRADRGAVAQLARERLFERVRGLKARGVTVVLILHKIREVLAIADTVTVLRGGWLVDGPTPLRPIRPPSGSRRSRSSAAAMTALRSRSRCARSALGRAAWPARRGPNGPLLQSLLSLEDVSTRRRTRRAGAARHFARRRPRRDPRHRRGRGQRPDDACPGAVGAAPTCSAGNIMLAGDAMSTARRSAERRAAGLRVIPFERNSEGLSLSSALWENWSVRVCSSTASLRFHQPGGLRSPPATDR